MRRIALASLILTVGCVDGPTRMSVKAGPHDNEGRVLAASIPVHAVEKTPPPRKRYVARMVTKAPKIDGKLDDLAWTSAPSTGAFVNTMNGGLSGPDQHIQRPAE